MPTFEYEGAGVKGKAWTHSSKNRTVPLTSYGCGGHPDRVGSSDLVLFEANDKSLVWREIKCVVGIRSLAPWPHATKLVRGKAINYQFLHAPGLYQTRWIEFHCVAGQRIDRRNNNHAYFANTQRRTWSSWNLKLRKAWEMMLYDKNNKNCSSLRPPAWRAHAGGATGQENHSLSSGSCLDLMEQMATKASFEPKNYEGPAQGEGLSPGQRMFDEVYAKCMSARMSKTLIRRSRWSASIIIGELSCASICI